jgi:hypothetical protein
MAGRLSGANRKIMQSLTISINEEFKKETLSPPNEQTKTRS